MYAETCIYSASETCIYSSLCHILTQKCVKPCCTDVTAVTPMENCSSYRCPVTQYQCTATLFRAECSFHCSVLVCQTGSQQAVCHCSCTYGDLLFIQVCAVTQHQCTAALSRAKCSPHCSVLLCKTGSQQAVCHCSYTFGDLLFIQVCSDPAPIDCSSVQGKVQSPLFSAALQNRLTQGSLSLHRHNVSVCSSCAVRIQGCLQQHMHSSTAQKACFCL